MSTEFIKSTTPSPQLTAAKSSLFVRFQRALGPALPGLVLDLADLCSLTKNVGPWTSFPVGLLIGVWLSSFYPFGFGWRCVIAIASGLYTLAPGTEYIPLATILTCLGRFIEGAPPTAANATTTDQPVSANEELATSPVSLHRIAGTRAACPECGGTSLRYGQVAQRFLPAGSSVWAKGHEINAFVCLECGFVGHYVTSADLEQLRESQG